MGLLPLIGVSTIIVFLELIPLISSALASLIGRAGSFALASLVRRALLGSYKTRASLDCLVQSS